MIGIFFLSVYLTSPPGDSPWNFVTAVELEKTRMMPLPVRQKKFDDILNHLETDRQ